MGFVVLQQYCSCQSADSPFCCKGGWRLALCGSRHLTPAEEGYAPIEGEALAVTWCLRKARLFLLGCPNLTIVTDHRPLVKLLGDRALQDVINPRLFNLKEKTLQFKFVIKYLPGKRNSAADFLSRYPAMRLPRDTSDEDLEDDLEVAVACATVAALGEEVLVLDEECVKSAASSDPVYQLLRARVSAGDWPKQKSQEIVCLRPFFSVRDRLAINQDLVTYSVGQGCIRLVIPEELRHQVAVNLHASHQGVDSMIRRARQSVYWPGIEGDLHHCRNQCTSCDEHAPSLPPEKMVLTPSPEYPFQQVVADMFQVDGQVYMAYADRLTGWLEIAHFPTGAPSSKICNHLRAYFSRWGAPEEISTDGGTNLASEEMEDFFKKWGVRIRLSSAHYPQSNGRAEAAVKSAKRLMRENTSRGGALESDKMALAVLQYLNTPLRDINRSPAQLATGRHLRDGIPMARRHLLVDRYWKKTIRKRELQVAKSQKAIHALDTTRKLPLIEIGTQVRVQNQATKRWDRTGVVIEAKPYRQYIVRLSGSGRLSLRNRRHLKAITTPASPTTPTPTATESSARPTQEPSVSREPIPVTPREQGVHPTQGPYVKDRPERRKNRPVWLKDFV